MCPWVSPAPGVESMQEGNTLTMVYMFLKDAASSGEELIASVL